MPIFPTTEDHRFGSGLLLVIALAVVVRLPGMGSPPTGHHSWRQADTAAMIRNFAEEGLDILYPRVDWRADTAGYVESEFPLYQFVVATLYRSFGVDEWLARLVSVAFLSSAIAYLALLLRALSDERTALWAALFLAVLPMPLFFGRAIMAESLLLTCCLATAYHFNRWIHSSARGQLFLAALFLGVACLIKPFTLWLVIPLLALTAGTRPGEWMSRWELWAGGLLVLASMAAWFSHAHRLAQETGLTFGIWSYATDKWGTWELTFSADFWSRLLLQRLPKDYLAWFGVAPFVVGLVRFRRSPAARFFLAWMLGLLLMSAIVSRGTYTHDYYWLPMAMPVCFFLGSVYAEYSGGGLRHRVARPLLGLCLVGMLVVSARTQLARLDHETREAARYEDLVSLVESAVPRDTRVVALDEANPLMLYMTHRKGWHADPETVTRPEVNAAARRGAGFLIGFSDAALMVDHPRIHRALSRSSEEVLRRGDAVVIPLTVPPRAEQ